jgi:hypothetical protein
VKGRHGPGFVLARPQLSHIGSEAPHSGGSFIAETAASRPPLASIRRTVLCLLFRFFDYVSLELFHDEEILEVITLMERER